MQNDEKIMREIIEMPPELSALEAALGTVRPAENSVSLERMRSAVLLEQCRLIEADLTPEFRRERIIETIEQASKEEISLSLNQYAKQLRFASSLTGGVVGFFLGILFAFFGIIASLYWLAPTTQRPISSIRETQYYLNPDSISSFDSTGEMTGEDRFFPLEKIKKRSPKNEELNSFK